MPKFRVQSGDLDILVEEKTFRKAGDRAIRIHDNDPKDMKLASITLVAKVDHKNKIIRSSLWVIATKFLLNNNTAGMGSAPGQYCEEPNFYEEDP